MQGATACDSLLLLAKACEKVGTVICLCTHACTFRSEVRIQSAQATAESKDAGAGATAQLQAARESSKPTIESSTAEDERCCAGGEKFQRRSRGTR